ncbi:hypothetical protein VTN77DRAFT_4759 [Rasamsonia byssochlamydoides]|uniref:uncharacterized protein n=1 Tax=Rasamsonia byssochlamydoides TaxID=89139 RepID=UPI003743574C
MASIRSLLNPLPESHSRGGPLPTSSSFTGHDRPAYHRAKKQKMPKDVPIFNRGKVRGELRYPPCEYQDAKLAEEHRRFQIHPMGQIGEFPRHIPYNSEKKSFLEKTGRESFEVFQYTFRIPGEEKTWTVMWDYNIGLVRTTHLFKCNDYSKTTPAKMLNANPGLRDICHSITGGALAAQGYWMPFEAAKAVAATFCWRIRYALTPLFGRDFPAMCIPPQGAQFGKMVIDPAIVRRATESANYYRVLELQSKLASSPATSTGRPALSRAATGSTATTYDPPPPRKKILSRSPNNRPEAVGLKRVDDTDSEANDAYSYCISPPTLARNSFTPINSSARNNPPGMTGRYSSNVPSPQEILESISGVRGGGPSSRARPVSEDRVDSSDGESSTSASESGSGIELATESDLDDENDSEGEEDDEDDDDNDDDEYMNEDASTTTTTTTAASSSSSFSSSTLSSSSSPSSPFPESEVEGERTLRPARTRTQTAAATRRTPRKKPRASTATSTSTSTALLSREVKAAHALLSLHMLQQDNNNILPRILASSSSNNESSSTFLLRDCNADDDWRRPTGYGDWNGDGDAHGEGRRNHDEHVRRKRRRRASA